MNKKIKQIKAWAIYSLTRNKIVGIRMTKKQGSYLLFGDKEKLVRVKITPLTTSRKKR